MEIRIREVDPVAVNKIDEMAKRKGISRQKFLKGQIEMIAFFQEQNKREMELQSLIEKNIYMMNKCTDEMQKMNQFIEMMMQGDGNE
ncbi:hypothetical protein QUF99_00230 [Bacillus sp. DX4.1]|uniref:hypothetical protein n=1 Tax=Bacillus sp. DX4.1 TaxID=3055867 RepID=UPI0025A29996|nr:hypothetical protein [Bacillus sp. DX4.1]MDM5185933.1 hypothetical protein [Bacillus sp. DX4.1]